MYTLASPYYTKEYYTLAYDDTIYPVSSQLQWNVPDKVSAQVVKPHEVKERKAKMLEITFSRRKSEEQESVQELQRV